MAMTDEDRRLEPFFEAARTEAPEPSAALMARILADAQAAQEVAAPAPARRRRFPGWRLPALAGGWGAAGGLAAATLAGVWIGFAATQGAAGAGLWPATAEIDTLHLLPDEEVFVLAGDWEG